MEFCQFEKVGTLIHARAKAKSLPICYIVLNLCVYTVATAAARKDQRKKSLSLSL